MTVFMRNLFLSSLVAACLSITSDSLSDARGGKKRGCGMKGFLKHGSEGEYKKGTTAEEERGGSHVYVMKDKLKVSNWHR